MVWVLDDEEGVWPWSVFWNGEVEQGTDIEGLQTLSFRSVWMELILLKLKTENTVGK